MFVWAPVTATTPAGTIAVATGYPFTDSAVVTVTPAAGVTGAIPVQLRIPSWASGATVSVNGGAPAPVGGANGTFWATATPAGGAATTFTVNFNPTIRLKEFASGAVAVMRGALAYSVWIGQNISVLRDYPEGVQDLSITQPAGATPWNVALVVDRTNPGASLTFNTVSAPSPVPFNSTAIPVTITGTARVVNSWTVADNAAAPPPASPACAAAGACGSAIPVTLVPFGSTHIRMSVLPTA